MNYDQYKQATPDSYNFEEEKTCMNCMETVPDDKDFCSKWCKDEYFL